MSVADDLEAAAELLETKGWTRGLYWDETGAHCAVGALLEVTGGVPFIRPVGFRVNAAIEVMGFSNEALFMYWNDIQESAEPVIELMKQTAKDLRNRAKPDM